MTKLISAAILLAFLCPIASHSQVFETSLYRQHGLRDVNAIFFKPKEGRIVIIGELTQVALSKIQADIKESKKYKDIVVDSPGGDAESAIGIAEIINRLELRLIVDGRCFSACANFLFPAAKRKIVLPSGIVGIHEAQANFVDKGAQTYATGNEIESVLMKSKNDEAIEKNRIVQAKMRAFNVKYGVSNDMHQIFNLYLTRRKQLLGNDEVKTIVGTESCPRILMWILNREQLEKMGVRGIESFWYPETKSEKEALIPEFAQISDSLYFGDSDRLKLYCNPGFRNWLKLSWYKFINK